MNICDCEIKEDGRYYLMEKVCIICGLHIPEDEE